MDSTSPTSTSAHHSRASSAALGIELEPDDAGTCLRKRSGEVAGRAAGVEHVLRLRRERELEQPAVTTVGPLVERHVPRHATGSRSTSRRARGLGRAHRQEAEEERAEDDLRPERDQGEADGGRVLVREAAEAVERPADEDDGDGHDARAEQAEPDHEAVLQAEASVGALDERVGFAEMGGREGACEDPELDDLRPEQDGRDAGEERVDLPRPPEQRHGAGRQGDGPDRAEEEQDEPRREVQPARAVEEHELHVAPGVAEAVQLRLADARVVVDRDLADAELPPERLEDHLRRELHPGRVEVERRKRVLAHCSHAAMRIRDLDAEEQVEHPREDRVADVTVEPRHGLAVDRPLEARAHHEVVAGRELVDERPELPQRVGLVGVPHHDVLPAGDREPGEVCAPVSRALLADDDRTVLRGDLGGGIRGGVVDDDHLAGAARVADPVERLVDDLSHRLFLVQAGNDDGDLGRCGGHLVRRTTVPCAPAGTFAEWG